MGSMGILCPNAYCMLLLVKEKMKILLFCKRTNWTELVQKILYSHFSDDVRVISGNQDSKWDRDWEWIEADYIISFQSPWIIPSTLLNKARQAAINFHPASVEYPGSCCYNFAIYERAKVYGATCHYMLPQVDTGDIIDTIEFSVAENETPETLKMKTMLRMITLFDQVMIFIKCGYPLPASNKKWIRKPFTYDDFYKLCSVNESMGRDEIELRIKSCAFPGYRGAYINLCGHEFKI
jgi:methionyl-tRNA formyltransferase